VRGWIMYNLPTTAQLRITWYYVRVSSALPESFSTLVVPNPKYYRARKGKVPCNCPSQLGSRWKAAGGGIQLRKELWARHAAVSFHAKRSTPAIL
jgi:hypothetical protein